jgi:hypothetical protein
MASRFSESLVVRGHEPAARDGRPQKRADAHLIRRVEPHRVKSKPRGGGDARIRRLARRFERVRASPLALEATLP